MVPFALFFSDANSAKMCCFKGYQSSRGESKVPNTAAKNHPSF
jgi:hypothetical protein